MHLRDKFVTQKHIMKQNIIRFNITLNIQQRKTKPNVKLKLENKKS